MIDPKSEQLYALKYARRWFPRRRRGKRPALATLYRYANEGYRGTILETVQVGATRCTTKAAVARFIRRTSEQQLRPAAVLVPRPAKTAEQIDRALEDAGFDRCKHKTGDAKESPSRQTSESWEDDEQRPNLTSESQQK